MADFTPGVCTPKSLPPHKLVEASHAAREENPVNGAPAEKLLRVLPNVKLIPEAIAVLTTKYLGPAGARKIPVQFMDGGGVSLQSKILRFANKWGKAAGVKFVKVKSGGFVRLARAPGEGYWSYLGTDCRLIPADQQTMNLDSFSMQTPDSEFDRVVCHEFGHSLGAPHEHMRRAIIQRLDPEAVIAEFMRTQGWSREEVIAQILTPVEERSLLTPTPPDETSIMAYQIPAELTRDHKPVLGGTKINPTDAAYMAKIYPRR
jgi:hypothetical protein